MATSGSVDFSVSRDNLIEDALRHAGIIGIEDSASAIQKTWAARLLNMMVKAWGAHGPALWARKVGYILPQTDTNEIDLGATGDHATASYTQTTLASSAADGVSSVVVTSATGISSGYYIGVETEDGMHWTTVNGAPVGTTVTLTDALTADAASGAYVWVYQTKLVRPLHIFEAYVRNEDGNTEYSIDVVAKQIYESMGNKETESTPNLLAYEPLLGDGRVYIQPRISGGETIIKIVFQRPFEDFDAANDTPDFPQEWYLALMLGLASLCAGAGGLPPQDRQLLKQEAKMAFEEAQLNEPEQGSFTIYPDDQGR